MKRLFWEMLGWFMATIGLSTILTIIGALIIIIREFV